MGRDIGERISPALMRRVKKAHMKFYQMPVDSSTEQQQGCARELDTLEGKIRELFSHGRKLDRLTKVQGEGVIIMLADVLTRNL